MDWIRHGMRLEKDKTIGWDLNGMDKTIGWDENGMDENYWLG